MNDHREKLIELLYGDSVDEASLRRLVGEEPELRRELEALQAMKQRMDGRKRVRPDLAVLDQIETAAASAVRPGSRKPMIHTLFSTRYWMSAAAAVLLALGGVLWIQLGGQSDAADAMTESVLAWEEDGDLESIYLRIQALKEQNDGLLWDESGIPLELVPLDDPGAASLPRHEAMHQW